MSYVTKQLFEDLIALKDDDDSIRFVLKRLLFSINDMIVQYQTLF
jgi:hypothetical protein